MPLHPREETHDVQGNRAVKVYGFALFGLSKYLDTVTVNDTKGQGVKPWKCAPPWDMMRWMHLPLWRQPVHGLLPEHP
jgi:hypothetical protein